MATLFQNTDASATVYLNINGATWGGSPFKTPNDGNSYTLSSITFELNKSSSPTGTVSALLYANTGTFGSTNAPTGSVLSTATKAANTFGASPGPVTFTFPDDYAMAPNTVYHIIIKDPADSGGNFINFRSDNVAGNSTNGIGAYSTDSGGSWTQWTNYISPFTVTGTLVAAGPANLVSLDTNLKANITSVDTNLLGNIKSLDTNA